MCITLRITGFSNFVHRENTNLRKLDVLPSSGKMETRIILDPLKTANLNHWDTQVIYYSYWTREAITIVIIYQKLQYRTMDRVRNSENSFRLYSRFASKYVCLRGNLVLKKYFNWQKPISRTLTIPMFADWATERRNWGLPLFFTWLLTIERIKHKIKIQTTQKTLK